MYQHFVKGCYIVGCLDRLFVRGANWPPLETLYEELATRFDMFRGIVFATLYVETSAS